MVRLKDPNKDKILRAGLAGSGAAGNMNAPGTPVMGKKAADMTTDEKLAYIKQFGNDKWREKVMEK
jgi:hypothetical protein